MRLRSSNNETIQTTARAMRENENWRFSEDDDRFEYICAVTSIARTQRFIRHEITKAFSPFKHSLQKTKGQFCDPPQTRFRF